VQREAVDNPAHCVLANSEGDVVARVRSREKTAALNSVRTDSANRRSRRSSSARELSRLHHLVTGVAGCHLFHRSELRQSLLPAGFSSPRQA